MPTVSFPAVWPDVAAPVANLLTVLGSPWAWWAAAAIGLVAGLALYQRRPRVALALAVAATLALGVAANGVVDDAYIQFRYAANLAAGQGPVFNPGERIEGASGGLWIGVLAAGERLTGLEPGIVGRLLSLLFATLATLLVGLALLRRGPPAQALAALAWAALPTLALYAASGLETTAAAAALWLAVWGVARDRSWPAAIGGVLLVGLRPEAPLLALLLLPWARKLPKSARIAIAASLVAAAALTLARTAYFGEPVPHSAIVKAATSPGLAVGLAYLSRLVLEAAPLVLLLPLLRRERGLYPVLVTVTIATLAVAGGGGDWMPGTRYLLPALALLIATVGWSAAGRWTSPAVAVQIVLCLVLLLPSPDPGSGPAGLMWRQMAQRRVQSRWWEALGTWIGHRVPSDWTVATGPAGAIPYASHLPTFDLYGLLTPVGDTRPGGEAGHRAWGLPQALARHVELVYGVEAVPQRLEPDELDRWILAAAARHPRLAEGWAPVAVVHSPAHHLDILSDVIWVRRDLLPRLERSTRRPPPAPAAPPG